MLVDGALNNGLDELSDHKCLLHDERVMHKCLRAPDALSHMREQVRVAEVSIREGKATIRGRKVRSLVVSEGEYDSPLAKRLRDDIKSKYSGDVLSGEVNFAQSSKYDKGPVGQCRIKLKEGAIPKAARPYKLVGEREAALREIAEEFLNKGWLEESSTLSGHQMLLLSPRRRLGSGGW